jgi:DNA-binding transcriptional LysR family regulator
VVNADLYPATVSVNGAESFVASARFGLGLIQVPRYHVEDDLKRGTLVAVLPDCPPSPTPVSLLYPRNRQLSPRVRVFIDWLMRAFDAARGTGHGRDLTGLAHTD